MKDSWGDIPLFYAFGAVPRTFPPILNLITTQQRHFPYQTFDMEALVLALADARIEHMSDDDYCINIETFASLLEYSIEKRLDSLNNSGMRDELMIGVLKFRKPPKAGRRHIQKLYTKLNSFENIKEAMSLLELAICKESMADRSHKKVRTDNDLSYRNQCRVNCGAEIVINNVLPYLWQRKDPATLRAMLFSRPSYRYDSGSESDEDPPRYDFFNNVMSIFNDMSHLSSV